jgi:hypothetical protein
MSGQNFEIIQPQAFALLDSLRSFGYSLTDAIADLIDNSITAKANSINIIFRWNGGKSSIYVIDDGEGMSKEELKTSMSLGVNGPAAQRNISDLGRFGLGMKTASLSQAKVMKVYSKKNGSPISGLSWDLDYVSSKNEWAALVLNESNFENEKIKFSNSGTIVILEKLDRVINISSDENDQSERKYFYEQIENVERNLGIIFHRFIEDYRLKIFINENLINESNPLHLDEDETVVLCHNENLKSENCNAKITSVLLSKKTIEKENLNPNEITSRQGILVYRNNRIVSWGKWLGLSSGNNSDHRYFRLIIEFKANDDQKWNIDVKKTNVTIPRPLIKKLKLLIKYGQSRSREMVWNNTFIRKNSNESFQPLWLAAVKNGQNILIINKEFPLIKRLLNSLENKKDFHLMLGLLETSLTVTQMEMDDEKPEFKSFAEEMLLELGANKEEIESLYESLKINK